MIGCVCATVSIFFLPCLFHRPMRLRAGGADPPARELLVLEARLARPRVSGTVALMRYRPGRTER